MSDFNGMEADEVILDEWADDDDLDADVDADDEDVVDAELVDHEPVDEGGELVVRGPSVGEELVRVSGELDELSALVDQLEAEADMAEPTSGTALMVGGGDALAIDAKRRAAAMRIRAGEARDLMKAKGEELRRLMEDRMSVVRHEQARLAVMVKQAEEAIWTISLYLGNQEQIHRLRDGEPAPAETPITVRQLVLYMDEECAVATAEGGIDAVSIDQFDRWLLEDPAHLDQVLPETKGIVAMRPRRRTKRRENDDSDAAKADRMAYFLVRNGERLFRLFIDPDLHLGTRLVPSAEEFRLAATDRFGDPIEPDSHAWREAAEAADDRRRHFMRIALILEGLVHRTTVLQPLHPAGVSFLEGDAHEQGRVAFIRDGDRALTDGRESFKDWQKRLMADMRPGMRVVGAFNLGYHEGLAAHNYDSQSYSRGNARLHPTIAEFPESGEPYVLDKAPDGGLVFRYWERRPRYIGDSWGMGGELRLPKVRASCRVERKDDWLLPFDLVEPDDLRRFMADRVSRQDYLRLFPLFKSIIAAKAREAEAEAPFRELLVGRMMAENGVTEAEARADLDDLVWWWKSKTKLHRPLLLEAAVPEFDEAAAIRAADETLPHRSNDVYVATARQRHEQTVRELREAPQHAAKAVRMIVAEHARVMKDRRRPISEKVVADLLTRYPAALAIVRPRGEGYRVILPEGDGPYVAWEDFTAKGEPTGRTAGWQLVGKQRHRWTLAYAAADWSTWDFDALPDKHLTGPERAQLTAHVRDAAAKLVEKPGHALLAVGYDTAWVAELGGRRGPEVQTISATWKRLPSGELRIRTSAQSRYEGSPFLRRGEKRDERKPWNRTEQLVERFPGAIARYEEAREKARQRAAIQRAHDQRAQRAYDALAAAWLEREDRRRYDEFLAEYGDPGLWEGHRKMLPELKLDAQTGYRANRILLAACRAGVEPEGHTLGDVAETLRAARVPTIRDGGRREYEAAPRELADLVVPKGGQVQRAPGR